MFEFLKKIFKKDEVKVEKLFKTAQVSAVEMGGNYCTDNC